MFTFRSQTDRNRFEFLNYNILYFSIANALANNTEQFFCTMRKLKCSIWSFSSLIRYGICHWGQSKESQQFFLLQKVPFALCQIKTLRLLWKSFFRSS